MSSATKILFLDIDGVLQPRTQKRFAYHSEIPALCKELERRTGGRYPYSMWVEGNFPVSDMDIAAVYYDWVPDAVDRLRYVLDVTGAKIVISSNWREGRTAQCIRGFLAIHGLDDYLLDGTYSPYNLPGGMFDRDIPEKDRRRCEALQEISRKAIKEMQDGVTETYSRPDDKHYIELRTVEIREYLDRHPEVVSYVAVDDMHLEPGLDGHFVETDSYIEPEHMADILRVLSVNDGPFPLPEGCRGNHFLDFRTKCVPAAEERWLRFD